MHAHDDERYRDALQHRVCCICLDSDDEGRCALRDASCAMLEQLGPLAATVLDLSRRGDTRHRLAVEERVCPRCSHRDPAGSCRRRDEGRCAVVLYLPLIVEALQQSR